MSLGFLGLDGLGTKKMSLAETFWFAAVKAGGKSMLQHSALLSLKPKAQTAIASVKANAAARRLRRRGPARCGARLGMTASAAASRLIQFFSRKSGWAPLMRSPRENARQHDGLNWSVFEFYLDDVLKLQNKTGVKNAVHSLQGKLLMSLLSSKHSI